MPLSPKVLSTSRTFIKLSAFPTLSIPLHYGISLSDLKNGHCTLRFLYPIKPTGVMLPFEHLLRPLAGPQPEVYTLAHAQFQVHLLSVFILTDRFSRLKSIMKPPLLSRQGCAHYSRYRWERRCLRHERKQENDEPRHKMSRKDPSRRFRTPGSASTFTGPSTYNKSSLSS
ncbi:uncharacterized protein EI90DRAFT_3067670 [Cantharellus anzutake]|uniref:uncharacterized protein n=1 Tax=Cantharellus anzutake TaxID=1750568 RepID=UPI0019066C2E|nr:uncharacterized protein EI90DRAFT_3067670 [Cantharellus anzutake]KAF8327419.1 hypothetical protein EI90DRAFT_3067670 [Cantharellus anzutake]